MAEKNLLNLVINTYFATMGAAELMMRYIESEVETPTSEMKHSLKQAHNRVVKAAHDFRAVYYHYMEQEKIACMKDAGGDYDLCRADENELARLLLDYADRTDKPTKAQRVTEWMHYLPANVIPEGFLEEYFTLK